MSLAVIFNRNLLVFVFVFVVFVVTGCSSPESDLTATKQHRFDDELVLASDLSFDGSMSVIVTDLLSVSVWNNNTLSKVAEWDANQLGITPLFVDISLDKKQLFVAGENQVALFDVDLNSEIGRWPIRGVVSDYKITAASYFQEIDTFVLGMNDGAVVIADLVAGIFKKAPLHTSSVTHFALDKSQQYVLSAGHDGLVNKALREDLSIVSRREFEHRISALVVDERTNKVFISDTLDEQVVIDAHSFQEISSLTYSQRWQWFKGAQFVENGRFLITSSPKTGLFMWEVSTGKQVAFWDAQVYSLASQVLSVALNGDNQLVTLTNDSVVETWQYNQLL
jgi:WD40 repeat protein